MTIEDQQPTTMAPSQSVATVPAETATPDVKQADVKQMASTAKDESAAVATTAVEGGREVVGEVADQVSVVAGNAKEQFTNLVTQAQDELRVQGEARGQQVVSGLQTFSDQLSAMVHGRPDQAGGVGTVLADAQQRVQRYVRSVQDRGPRALLDDTTAFARRRPAVFLVAASITGFVVGRLVRSGAAAASDSSAGTAPSETASLSSTQPDSSVVLPPAGPNRGVDEGLPLPSADERVGMQ
jgi:ElaB/YqjD/DUF883 family membrane-anchored ribosome-binding protein